MPERATEALTEYARHAGRQTAGSILLGKHDDEHAAGFLRVARILRAPAQRRILIIHFPEELLPFYLQGTEVVLAMRVVERQAI